MIEPYLDKHPPSIKATLTNLTHSSCNVSAWSRHPKMATAENQKWQESLANFVCGSKSVKDNQLTEFLATHQLQQQQQQDDSRLIATKKRGSLKPLIAVRSSVQHCQPLRNCALPWLEWPGLNVSSGFASHVSSLCQESATRFSSPHCTQTLPAPFYCS